MSSPFRVSLALLCVLAHVHVAAPAPLERSVSSSRQFLVYGTDVHLRGAVCDLAERTKLDVIKLLDERDRWSTPILINVQSRRANLPEQPSVAMNFAQTGFGLKLQLDLAIAPDMSQPEIRRALLRAILLEMMYRAKTDLPAGKTYVPPPAWLLGGILPQQTEWDRERLIGILGAPATARKILPLKEFLRQRPERLEGPGSSLHEAYASALVELVTRMPEGRKRLARFITDLPAASSDSVAHLGSHFPELYDPNSAEKVWSMHISQLALSQPFRLFSAEETEKKLDAIAKFMRSTSPKVASIQCSRDLNILATRANPIYRPLISEYARITARLARGKARGTAETLARLSALRKRTNAAMREITDYINWFEATQPAGLTGAFTGYFRAAEVAAGTGRKKRDAISVYLDVLEAQFQN